MAYFTPMNRRRFLTGATGAAVVVSLAGCLGMGDDDNGDDANGDDANGEEPASPTAAFNWTPKEPTIDEAVTFDAGNSEAPDTDIVEYRWNFAGSAETSTDSTVEYMFDEMGEMTVELEIEDDQGNTDSISETVAVVAPEAYDTAINILVDVAEELDRFTDPEVERDESDLETLQNDLDGAEAELETLDPNTVATRAETAREVLEFQRLIIEEHERSIEIIETYSTAFLAVEDPDGPPDSGNGDPPSDDDPEEPPDDEEDTQTDTTTDDENRNEEQRERFEKSIDLFGEVEQLVSDHESAIGELENTLAALDATPLNTPALAYDGELTQFIRYSRDELVTLAEYGSYQGAFFSGMIGLFTGREAFEDEQWVDARDGFSSAETDFQLAFDTVESLEPENLQRVVIELPDRIDVPLDLTAELEDIQAFVDTATCLKDAAELGNDGNIPEAQTQFEECDTVFESR